MDVWVAYYYDSDVEDLYLIGVARTSDGAKELAERWARQYGVTPNYATWRITSGSGEWTRGEIFVRLFTLSDGVAS